MRKIKLARAMPRLFIPVEMTAKCRKQFPDGPATGTLIRYAQDGRWIVRRDGRVAGEYWAKGMWRKVKLLGEREGQ